MNKKFATGTVLALLLAGCSAENGGETENPEPEAQEPVESPVEEGTQEPEEAEEEQKEPEEQESADEPAEEISLIEEVKQQLETDIPAKLPEDIETLMGNEISAVTQSDSNSYTVEFYATENPVPVNDPSLQERSDAFAVFTAASFENAEQAEAEINHQEYTGNDQSKIDLGYGIIGIREGAAGSQYIGWNEGRWDLSVRGTTEQGDSLTDDAKTVVEFLEDHFLPAPQSIGAAQFDATEGGKREQVIAWQEDTIVYKLTTTESYERALQFTVTD